MIFFSQHHNLPVSGHKDLDFVDINLNTDIRLFLDPSLIKGTLTEWCQQSQIVLNNFFTNVFNCCKINNKIDLYRLLSFGHEPNETKLGLSEWKSQGKGTSPDSLYKIFSEISKELLDESRTIVNPMDVCVFVSNFAEDRMSDLVTNVLRKQLYEFTVTQCKKHNISLSDKVVDDGKYWDEDLESWETLRVNPLIVNGSKILLVPKNIVRQSYIYSVEQYIWQYIIPIRQEYHFNNLTSLAQYRHTRKLGDHYVPPTKKTVYEEEIKGKDHKGFAQKFGKEEPQSLLNFRDSIMKQIATGSCTLSDTKLDHIVYKTARDVS